MWGFSELIPRGRILKVYLSFLLCCSNAPLYIPILQCKMSPTELPAAQPEYFLGIWALSLLWCGSDVENIFLGHVNHESGYLGLQCHWASSDVQTPSTKTFMLVYLWYVEPSNMWGPGQSLLCLGSKHSTT